MITDTIKPDLVLQLEMTEINAWIDIYKAAPTEYAQQYQLQVKHLESVVILLCKAIPFRHFNSVMGLGLREPATEQLVDEVLEVFEQETINAFYIHLIPPCQPDSLADWLQSRNLKLLGSWDRIYRDGAPLLTSKSPDSNFRVERVTSETASDWAGYIDSIYGLPTKPWLMALVGRDGWHHYILRQGTEIVAARSMYLDSSGIAWLGIDAPVPGVMAPSYDLDDQICREIVEAGLRLGARYFITDIEAPASTMETPAYHNFGALGFKRLYLRSNYGA
ncbi:MAG: hypothetical protein WCA35_00790 [Kovacikia sp.]